MTYRSSGRPRTGAALLEAIMAVTILATAGIAALSMSAQAARVVQTAHETEAALRRASAFMEAVALWTRDDLDRRLGDRAQGPWLLRVDHPVAELYVIALADTLTGETLIQTALFRPQAHP